MRYLQKQRPLKGIPRKDILVAIVFLGVIGLLVVSALWAYRQYITTPPYVDKEKYPVRGIDISRHNGEIDFNKVADSGIDFVIIKASEGISHRDSLFSKNFEGARRAGIKTGAYHFFRFDKEGVGQAVNFLEAVGEKEPDMNLAIDVEAAGNPKNIPVETVKERLQSMVEYLNLLGYRVMIYTNNDGYYDYIADVLPGYPLWICRFKENPINAEWTLWQYDHHGKVPGITGDVDLNAFCGSKEDWDRFLRGAEWPYAVLPENTI